MRASARWLTVALMALVLGSSAAFAQSRAEEEAGDTSEVDKDSSGPLRDRIPPVSGHLFLMNGRFEVSPGLGISIRDAFFTKFLLGAAFTYHFTETLGVSLRGGYALSFISGAAQICTPADPMNNVAGSCRLPTTEELTRENGVPKNLAFGFITLLSSLDLQWAPIYGKLSLSAEKFLYFNMYALAGPSLVIYGPTNELAPGGNVGLGFRFFLNKWMTVRTELRDTIYFEKGFPNDSLRNQLMVEVGFSMFFPTIFREAP